MSERKISLCLTNYNRTHMLAESFVKVLEDPRISEIVIADDASKESVKKWLEGLAKSHPKIRVITNSVNQGMGRNKAMSVELASNEWCIVFDSDNVIDPEYINAIFNHMWDPEVIYCPSFASPQFDYREFNSLKFDKKSVKRYMKKRMFECLLNTCNYFVNRDKYLEVYQHNPAMKGTDTIWFNYLWLKAGYSFYVVPGMHYFHRVHDGSGFMEDVSYNMKKAAEVKRMIERL